MPSKTLEASSLASSVKTQRPSIWFEFHYNTPETENLLNDLRYTNSCCPTFQEVYKQLNFVPKTATNVRRLSTKCSCSTVPPLTNRKFATAKEWWTNIELVVAVVSDPKYFIEVANRLKWFTFSTNLHVDFSILSRSFASLRTTVSSISRKPI